jgi:5-methylcytosine-specific restriction enzyme subunit McrC
MLALTKTIFEFGYIVSEINSPPSGCCSISEKSFEWLEKQCLKQDEECRKLLRYCTFKGVKAFQVLNYVGVISTPYNEQIEVLPKIAKTAKGVIKQEDISRKSFLNMLRHLKQFRHIESSDSMISTHKMPLLEVFVRQFLLSVNMLIKRGLRSDYIRVEENQTFMKGRLLIAKQLRHNLFNQHKFYVEYDEFLPDRPVNRILHSALARIASFTKTNINQKLCRELMFAFADVPKSTDIKSDFNTMKLGRGMDMYDSPIAWARLILNGDSPLSMDGKSSAISLLFPMEAIFESYVASILRKQLKQEHSLKEQIRSETLVKHKSENWFRLKPDLTLHAGNDKYPICVMDTKWKILDASKGNGTNKYGLSQSDFYQMFAYGQKYLKGQGVLVLIYPRTEKFNEPIKDEFIFSDGGKGLRLYVLPFDVSDSCDDSKRLLHNGELDSYFS